MGTVQESLTVNMKATLGLIAAFIVYFIAGIAATLATGPVDMYAVLSLVFIVPYAAFFYFGKRRKKWAFLGSAVLSVLLLVLIPLNASFETWEQTTPYLNAMGTVATLLFGLTAVEGYKAYLEA